jgi:phosphatidylserine/phosphatidylglycerophosphate/cardiolipin synthase-like enzyme
MTISGAAAGDAQRYADYLWTYLNALPDDATLHTSVTPLTGTKASFTAADAPMYSCTPTYSGSLNALSVGKSGLASFFVDEYPAQIFDALRDFLLNIIAAVDNDTSGATGQLTAHLTHLLSDSNSAFRQKLLTIGVNPASWASRYARCYAVGQATTSVRMTQQKLVMDDLYRASTDYQDLVAAIQDALGSTWDGYIWPYDLLFGMGQALATMSTSNGAATGIELVCSTRDTANGYEDPVSAVQFAQALTTMMNGMQADGLLDSTVNIDSAVSTYLHYKRIDPDTSHSVHANHSKVVMVDDALMYVGSDNAYSSYNEEFGVWLDDSSSITAYLNQYWATLWQQAYPG